MSLTQVSNQVIQQPYRKNFLINGCMRVAQRVSVALSTAAQYGGVDRWKAVLTTATGGTVSQATIGSTSGSRKAVEIANASCTSGGVLAFETRVESKDSTYLGGKTITFSAYVYHNFGSTTNFKVYFYKPNAVDDFSAATQLFESANIAVLSGTWAQVLLTATLGDTDANNGFRVQIAATGLTLSAKSCFLAAAQLEIGSVATTLEYRPFAEELALCQRYYEKSFAIEIPPGSTNDDGRVLFYTPVASYYLFVPFKTRKRIAPSTVKIFSYTTGAEGYIRNAITAADVAITAGTNWQTGFEQRATVTAGHLIGFQWTADAEL